jgi:hypothetical protein
MSKMFPKEWRTFENGSFHNGKLRGCGIAKYGSFGYYVGNFADGMRSGLGKMIWKDPERFCTMLPEYDATYLGQWKNDERHGLGEIKWGLKYRYKGYYRHDVRHKVTGTMIFN